MTDEDSFTLTSLNKGEYILSSRAVEVLGVQTDYDREVELRCPTGPRKLFAKLRMSGVDAVVNSDNLIELSCQDCRRRLRSQGKSIRLVLHRYNIVGELIETIVLED